VTNVIQLKSLREKKKHQCEAAALWIVKIDAGLTPSEKKQLALWLEEDADHGKSLLHAASIWDQVSVLSVLSTIFPLDNTEGYLQHHGRHGCKKYMVAATLLLSLLYCAMTVVGRNNELIADTPAQENIFTYTTAIGEQNTIDLQDGSEVILNTNTRIEVAFTNRARNILLESGEAHFRVAKDQQRPFRVRTLGGTIEAVGTAFAVEATTGKVELFVEEGVVNFFPVKEFTVHGNTGAIVEDDIEPGNALINVRQIELSAGDLIVLDKQSEVITKSLVETVEFDSRLAWRDGMIHFDGDSLEDAILQLSKYTSTKIELDDSVKDIPVLGYFKIGDINAILIAMQTTFGLNIETRSDTHIRLTKISPM
jgi:transmembrane sensor